MNQTEGQTQPRPARHKLSIIVILSIAVVIIAVAIILIITLPKPSTTSDPAPSQESTPISTTFTDTTPPSTEEIEKLNDENTKTENLTSVEGDQTEQIDQLNTTYAEILNNNTSSISDKVIAANQSAKLYISQENYFTAIEILQTTLDNPSITASQALLLLSQLEDTYQAAGDKESSIKTIEQILSLPDDTDLSAYNTDMASVKENYQFILEQLRNETE